MVAFDRWETRFAKFVRAFGTQKLADTLQIKRSAIYHWISGSVQPHPENAKKVVALAKSIEFDLSLSDVYTHADAIR